MANTPPEETEILVHITAPSRAVDDVAYRQLAQAYLDFAPQHRTQIDLGKTKGHVPKTQRDEIGNERARQTRGQAPTPSSQVPTSTPAQALEINSQDISFESALDNRSSPRLLYTATRNVLVNSSQERGAGSQISWCPPSSEISDSYPMPEPGLLQVSPSRVLRHYVGRPAVKEGDQTPTSPSRKRRLSTSTCTSEVDVTSPPPAPVKGTTLGQCSSHVQSRQIIPVTPSTTDGPDENYLAKAQARPSTENSGFVGDTTIEITHISSSGSGSSSQSAGISPRAESEPPPPPKRARTGQLEHRDLVRSSSDTGPILSSSVSNLDKINTSLEIRPPSPPIGIGEVDPDDMIPPKFAKLAKDLSSRYRPEAKRVVDPFERGYWLLDCSTWSQESRFGAWVFLNNYLRSSLAGWGTWCRRDHTHDWIRLYCWGHVTKHTYLLLYLASERHLKTTGARWYDAGGELVLEVPPYEK